MQKKKHKTRYRLIQLWTVLLILFMLSGCILKVKWAAQYDEVIDTSIHNIQSKTAALIMKIISYKGFGDGSFEKNKQFYFDIKGELQALVIRSQTFEADLEMKPLTANMRDLVRQYNDLEILHKTFYSKAVYLKAQDAFDQSFRAIIKHIIYLKLDKYKPEKN